MKEKRFIKLSDSEILIKHMGKIGELEKKLQDLKLAQLVRCPECGFETINQALK